MVGKGLTYTAMVGKGLTYTAMVGKGLTYTAMVGKGLTYTAMVGKGLTYTAMGGKGLICSTWHDKIYELSARNSIDGTITVPFCLRKCLHNYTIIFFYRLYVQI